MIKQLIKFSLNHIPRPVLQRIAGWAVPVAGLFYKGRGAECPVCGAKYRKFMPYGYVQPRPNALCPKCLSLERHRLLWLYLTRETDLLTAFPRTLHIAPEVCIMRHLKPHFKSHPGQYVTADLESPLADLHFDVQQIPLADGSVDVVICNHIMEHVADDRRAMRELHRVLKPGGWGIVLSPVDRDYEQTYEDDSITDPDERTRIFGQYDHRRIYGADYARPPAPGGFPGRGHRLRRDLHRGRAQAIRPAGRSHVCGLQSLTGGRRNGCQTGIARRRSGAWSCRGNRFRRSWKRLWRGPAR